MSIVHRFFVNYIPTLRLYIDDNFNEKILTVNNY